MNETEHPPEVAVPAPRILHGTTPGDGPPAGGALPDTALEAVGGGQGILKLVRDLYDLAVHSRER